MAASKQCGRHPLFYGSRVWLLATYVLCLSFVNFAVGTYGPGSPAAFDHKHGTRDEANIPQTDA